jgi:GNAT superfamily N-acetyltransferase
MGNLPDGLPGKEKTQNNCMIFREALTSDIKQIQVVRNAVKENMLSNPGLVTDKDCVEYLTLRGKGWVCETDGIIVAFAIADLIDNNIWALFVHPVFENKGIGKKLHDAMLNWYFDQQKEMVWLSTSPGTRAEKFYRMQGWKEAGLYGKGEIKFEMTRNDWQNAGKAE